MQELRIGLIGCGFISEDHVRAYQKSPSRARVTLCYDVDPAKAAVRAEQAGGGARVASTLEELINSPDIDAVDICTPPHLHADAAVAAAKAGKHISCQKPLACTLADCDRMIAAAKAAGVVLYHAEFNRNLPAGIQARELVKSGRIGRLVGIQATFAYWQGGKFLSTPWRYDPKISGGGQLLDAGIHSVDLVRSIGGEVHSVSCMSTRFREELGGEDTAVVNIRFQAGHVGSLYSTQACGVWSPTPRFIAYGMEGVLVMGGQHGALAIHRNDRPDRTEVIQAARDDWMKPMVDGFVDPVLDGTPNPSPGEEGRANLLFVLAAYESERRGVELELAAFRETP